MIPASSLAAKSSSSSASRDNKHIRDGVALFNRDPQAGISLLVDSGILSASSPADVSRFLQETAGLDRTKIGEYLADTQELNARVLEAFVADLNFEGLAVDEALRILLSDIELPSDPAAMDKILLEFSRVYHASNLLLYSSSHTSMLLALHSIILSSFVNHSSSSSSSPSSPTPSSFAPHHSSPSSSSPPSSRRDWAPRLVSRERFCHECSIVDDTRPPPQAALSLMFDRITRSPLSTRGIDTSPSTVPARSIKQGWMTVSVASLASPRLAWLLLSSDEAVLCRTRPVWGVNIEVWQRMRLQDLLVTDTSSGGGNPSLEFTLLLRHPPRSGARTSVYTNVHCRAPSAASKLAWVDALISAVQDAPLEVQDREGGIEEAGGSVKRRGTRLESFMSRAEGRDGDAEENIRLHGEGLVGVVGGETSIGGGRGGRGAKELASPTAGVSDMKRSAESSDSTLSSLRGRIEELESIVRSYEWEIECSRADAKRAFAMCATHQSGTWFLDMMASHLERVTAAASERLCRAREAGRRRGTWRAWVRYTRRKRRQRRGEGGRGRGGVLLAEMFDDWRLTTLRGKADQVRGYAYVSRLLSAGGGTPKAGAPPVQHWSAPAGGKPNGAGGTPSGARGTPTWNGGTPTRNGGTPTRNGGAPVH